MTSEIIVALIVAAAVVTAALISGNWHRRSQTRFESTVIESLLTLYEPETSFDETLANTIRRNYEKLRDEVRQLRNKSDWDSIIRVKERLREYFEYAGQYLQGVKFGEAYVEALRANKRDEEALWAKVKNVGYLLVLTGNHKAGRVELEAARSELETKTRSQASESMLECLFYCYRYLGVSVQRDPKIQGTSHTRENFAQCEALLERLIPGSRKHDELLARLHGNLGNTAIDDGAIDEAMQRYEASLQLFIQLEDAEHIGIARLKLSECRVITRSELPAALELLDLAGATFTTLPWIEGMARIEEQRAHVLAIEAEDTRSW